MEYISVQLCAKESELKLLDEIEAAILHACVIPTRHQPSTINFFP